MKKEDLAKLLKVKTEEFQTYGGQIVRYASRMNPDPIKLGAPPVIPENLRDAEWQKFIDELKAGTYCPDTDYKRPEQPHFRRQLVKGDGRGYRTIKGYGPKWK